MARKGVSPTFSAYERIHIPFSSFQQAWTWNFHVDRAINSVIV